MKKLALISLVLLSCLVTLSFKSDKSSPQEITITVTSEQPSEFAMFQSIDSNQSSTLTGLKTPYKTTIPMVDGKFIFRQKKANSNLKINFSSNTVKLNANWPITVVLVEGNTISTFGMN